MKGQAWNAVMRMSVLSAILAGPLFLTLIARSDPGDLEVFQHRFEGRRVLWVKGRADAKYQEKLHELTEDTAASGQRSEHLQLLTEAGSYIHYTHDVGQGPVNEDLHVSVWIKSNRPGIQLYCRAVLPRERDPNDPSRPLTVLLPGTTYKLVGRWQQLSLREPVRRLRAQQQLLRAAQSSQESGRQDISILGAYIDQVVLNLYGGPGKIDVWTDDLEVGPVVRSRPEPTQPSPAVIARPASRRPMGIVKLHNNSLQVQGRNAFFLRGIRHTGTPLWVLRQMGFNTVWLDESVPDKTLAKAVKLGFWIVPTITPPRWGDGRPNEALLASRRTFGRTVSRFLKEDAVLCWDLGRNLVAERFPRVRRTASAFRDLDPMRPVCADVWDGLTGFSRNVDRLMLGAHRWPLMTGLELSAYRDWLVQRRRLAAPGTFCWTWVQTHQPVWYHKFREADGDFQGSRGALARLDDGARNERNRRSQTEGAARVDSSGASARKTSPASGSQPIQQVGLVTSRHEHLEDLGPQPEQIRLMAYTAIGAGYRGLGFWSDQSLTNPTVGRDRLLGLALLNQELRMLEPMLVEAKEPKWIHTSNGHVRAAVLRCKRAILVLPIWMGPGAQFVPGQGASSSLTIKVPQVPSTYQAWEVSPGLVRSYPSRRVTQGREIKLHNFSLTAAIVFTGDLNPQGLVNTFQKRQHETGRLAAQYAHDQASEEFRKVLKVHEALADAGHTFSDAAPLVRKTQFHLVRCQEARRRGRHSEAYQEAQVALRSLRILMRAHWEKAVKPLDTPVASPYAVSFYSLPQHWAFWDAIRMSQPGRNVLPDGDFEAPSGKVPRGWLVQEVPTLDPVEMRAQRVKRRVPSGRQCLELHIKTKKGESQPQALERTFLALHSPSVSLPPGTPIRISAWVHLPGKPAGSADGALFYDSIGGEPLAARLSESTKWKRISLYRRVPRSGKVNVTVALTGIGHVYFDDLRIEPLGYSEQTPEFRSHPTSPHVRSQHQGQSTGQENSKGWVPRSRTGILTSPPTRE